MTWFVQVGLAHKYFTSKMTLILYESVLCTQAPCIKGHFYIQGINLMYHRSLYYKGQSYVKYIKSSLI